MTQLPPPKLILFDTSAFIRFFRGDIEARQWIEKVTNRDIIGGVSPITDYELWVGIRNAAEKRTHCALISRFRRLQLHTAITRRAGELTRQSQKSNLGADVIDYLLAATAEYYHFNILTTNVKHFDQLPVTGVEIIKLTQNS